MDHQIYVELHGPPNVYTIAPLRSKHSDQEEGGGGIPIAPIDHTQLIERAKFKNPSGEMAGDRACCLDSVVRGYHIYKRIWTPVIGKQLDVVHEDDNEKRFSSQILAACWTTRGAFL